MILSGIPDALKAVKGEDILGARLGRLRISHK